MTQANPPPENPARFTTLSASCRAMPSVVHRGSTRPAPLPSAGQIAPKMYTEAVRWSFAAEGRLPRRAQRRVSLFFCPTRASSANQISITVPPRWAESAAT